MPGTPVTEEYETAKDFIREKFEENPELVESDTQLVLAIIEEAVGISLPVDTETMPSIGTITRASRELRNEEGYDELVSDETQEAREKAESSMREHLCDSSQDDEDVLWRA